MNFSFTPEQLQLRDAVRELLARECPPSAVRAAWTNETGRGPGLWKKLAEAGVIGILAPEEQGGLGLSEVDLVLVLEETGRAACPEPMVETAAVAIPLMSEAKLLAEVATLSSASASISVELSGLRSVVSGSSTDWILYEISKEIWFDREIDLKVIPEIRHRRSVDGSRRLVEHVGTPGDCIAGGHEVVELAFDRGALGTSAQLLGLAQHLIDVTVEYVKVREQFKQPVGAFQAVKHHLADAHIKVEFARPLVYRAAWSVAHHDEDRSVHVSMAKAAASDAAVFASKIALQCHGAIGYSFEYDLHLWMKRAWALASAWGDANWHRARIASAILDRRTGEL